MIVPSKRIGTERVPDMPEEVGKNVLGYMQLPDGTYQLTLRPEYLVEQQRLSTEDLLEQQRTTIVELETQLVEEKERVTRLLTVIEESTVPEIRELSTKVKEREDADIRERE